MAAICVIVRVADIDAKFIGVGSEDGLDVLLDTRSGRFAGQALGDNLDELATAAAAFLATQHGGRWAIQALERACLLLPDALFSRGDLVVHLVQSAAADDGERAAALVDAARHFLEITPRATRACHNEEAVLLLGLAALWQVGATSLFYAALAAHRERIAEYPRVLQELGELGIPLR